MRRLLTAGIFGTILGIVSTCTANASIVSSGFLDEKLTEMTNATTLQLDTKANQSDLDFINMEVDPELWNERREFGSRWLFVPVAPIIEELFPDFITEPYVPDSISGTLLASLTRIEEPGIAGFTNKLLNGWTDENGALANPGLKAMYAGWTDENGALDNPGLKAMFDGWTDKGGTYFPGLYSYSKGETFLQSAYNSGNTYSDFSRLLINGANATTIRGVDYTGPVYPLWKLSEGIDKIGDLPTEIPNRETIWGRYGFVEAQGTPIDLPDTIGGMFAMLFNEDHRYRGLSLGNIMAKILMGFDNSNGVRTEGLDPLTNGWTDKNAGTTYLGVKDLNTKIGTLPDGIPPALATNMEELNERLSVKFDIKYPQSLEDLILDLYGTKEYKPGILQLALEAMLLVFDHEDTIIGVQSQNRKGILERIDNVETQIGTLPAGYDSVGAALTAIKGIAEDAKAAALAAIPDPKQEGSSGKFVLTVDIVGDNATYHWEKIDREGETTTTTTTE